MSSESWFQPGWGGWLVSLIGYDTYKKHRQSFTEIKLCIEATYDREKQQLNTSARLAMEYRNVKSSCKITLVIRMHFAKLSNWFCISISCSLLTRWYHQINNIIKLSQIFIVAICEVELLEHPTWVNLSRQTLLRLVQVKIFFFHFWSVFLGYNEKRNGSQSFASDVFVFTPCLWTYRYDIRVGIKFVLLF